MSWGDDDPTAPPVTWGLMDPNHRPNSVAAGLGPEAMRSSGEASNPPLSLPSDEAAGWATTRLRNIATGFAGIPRALSDLTSYGYRLAGATPSEAMRFNLLSPMTAVGQFSPSTAEMNTVASKVLPEVNSGSKIADAAVEAGLGGVLFPGAARNLIPSMVGGAASEAGGQAVQGSQWEPAVRLLGGLVGGAGAAGIQNVAGNIGQGLRNLRPDVNETAAKILARATARDQTTPEALFAKQAELGPGATVAEAGGPNVRGMMRGSIMNPGQSRTNVQNAFEDRIGGSNDRTTAALDSSISPSSSLARTTEDLAALRAQQATPAYQAAGIPSRPEMISPERKIQFAIDEPPTTIPAQWNTPIVTSPRLEQLTQDSSDIRSAIAAVRGLPDYKYVPSDSMTMWDKAYKHLGDMEQSAKMAGKTTRANDLKNLRTDFQAALADANPRYQRALDAYSGPSKLINAGDRAKEWFTKNIDPLIATSEFQAMTPTEQEAARIGVRDWARTVAGRSDRGIAAERVWAGGDNRARLQGILSPGEFAALEKTMGVEKNAIRTARDIGVGSRTAPMLAEGADNASQSMGALTDLMRGHPLAAGGRLVGGMYDRFAQGRTEAVNNRLSQIGTMTDPQQVGLVAAMANRARLEEAAKTAGRRNALFYGGVVAPGFNVVPRESR